MKLFATKTLENMLAKALFSLNRSSSPIFASAVRQLSAMNDELMNTRLKDPLLTMTLCAPNEKQDKGNLGQKGLSDNTKVDFGATKDHG